MSKVAVIYWSGTGNTEAMAQAVAEGAKAAGAETDLLTPADVSDVSGYDGVALGCPAMGSEELEDSEFVPCLDSIEGALAGKRLPCSDHTAGVTANGCAPGKSAVLKRALHCAPRL